MIEIVVVLAVFALLAGAFLATGSPGADRTVDQATRVLSIHIESALARARAQESNAAIAVRSNASDRRYVILVADVPPAPNTVPAGEWTRLPDGVLWSAGNATRTPLGAAISRPPTIPSLVRCATDRCVVPEHDAALYYLTHERDPAIVGAVALSRDGTVQAYRYQSGPRTWSALAR